MNFLRAEKCGERIVLGDGQVTPAGAWAHLPDGRYQAGFRASHLELEPLGEERIGFPSRLVVTEITGSETFVHLDHGGSRWVGIVQGVRDLSPGTQVTAWLDPRHVYIFGEGGDLVAPAAYAAAA